jgi:hypothetical protein
VSWLGRTSTDEQQDPTLSLPRQLTNCRRALPDQMTIVVHLYDVETLREELDQRGSSTGWTKFNIGIPRVGGIADLLAEANAANCRFNGVICESIDRIARFTYQVLRPNPAVGPDRGEPGCSVAGAGVPDRDR